MMNFLTEKKNNKLSVLGIFHKIFFQISIPAGKKNFHEFRHCKLRMKSFLNLTSHKSKQLCKIMKLEFCESTSYLFEI